MTIFSGLLVLVLGEWDHCFKPQRRRYLHLFPLNLYFSELLLQHFLSVYGFSIRASYLPWQPFIYLLSLTTLCKRVCSSRYIISALFYINWWLLSRRVNIEPPFAFITKRIVPSRNIIYYLTSRNSYTLNANMFCKGTKLFSLVTWTMVLYICYEMCFWNAIFLCFLLTYYYEN